MATCRSTSTSVSKVFDGIVTLFLLPETDIFFKKLDDGFCISEGLFIDIVNLLKCLGQSNLSKLISFLLVVHDFIVENREVQSKTKSNWVACVESLAECVSLLVSLKSAVFDLFDFIS